MEQKSIEDIFVNEVEKLKIWRSNNRDKWEDEYKYWGDLYSVTQTLITTYKDRLPNTKITNHLLYMIAIDSEAESLRCELSQSIQFYLDRHQNDPNQYVRNRVDEIKIRRALKSNKL